MLNGNQVFWVCPLIDESKKIDHESAIEKYKFLNNIFPNLVGLIHGSLNREEKEKTLKLFLNKKYKINFAVWNIVACIVGRECASRNTQTWRNTGVVHRHHTKAP